jgi:hypothetical protein
MDLWNSVCQVPGRIHLTPSCIQGNHTAVLTFKSGDAAHRPVDRSLMARRKLSRPINDGYPSFKQFADHLYSGLQLVPVLTWPVARGSVGSFVSLRALDSDVAPGACYAGEDFRQD